MYRAIIEVTKFSQSGWDSYEDTYEEYVENSNKKVCVDTANKLIDEITSKTLKGDFGITLCSYEATLKGVEKFSPVVY